jgi:hypothetical protein
VSIKQSELFDSLDLNTRNLIKSLNDNIAVFSAAVTQQTTVIRDLNNSTSSTLKYQRRQLELRLKALEVKKLRDENNLREEKILQHVGFPTMRVRSEDISPAHARTYNWIYEPTSTPQNCFPGWLETNDAYKSLFGSMERRGQGNQHL